MHVFMLTVCYIVNLLQITNTFLTFCYRSVFAVAYANKNINNRRSIEQIQQLYYHYS